MNSILTNFELHNRYFINLVILSITFNYFNY